VKCNGCRGRLQDNLKLYFRLGGLIVVHWIKLVQVEATEILGRATHETSGFTGNFL
jgi:hypothetical protein